MKFIIDICACAVTDGIPYVCAYYSQTTSKVLPTPLPDLTQVLDLGRYELVWAGMGMRLRTPTLYYTEYTRMYGFDYNSTAQKYTLTNFPVIH